MCGIAGIVKFDGLPDGKERMSNMLKAMAHRGPNASGMFENQALVLGHQRLSIIDLTEDSNQPFHSPDGRFTLTFNGEIYNYRELRSKLSSYDFKTNSDTEVLLAAYQEWGSKCLQMLNGMFAFAIWDQQDASLFIARDRIGIKPLYYAQTEDALVFASEVRSLLASRLVERKLNQQALPDYLMYQTVHAPSTLVEGVEMLMPGFCMTIKDQSVDMHRYWIPWQERYTDIDPNKIKAKVQELFYSSIEMRLISDVSFGAFLSGGIDSSLVVAAMSKVSDTVDTFNVSFDESEFSEARFAKVIAKKYNTNHHEICLNPEDFLASLPDALSAIDHPSGDGPNTWIVSRETKKQGISMALSGLGGDELFAGYDVFTRIPNIAQKEWILSFPKGLRKLAGSIYSAYKPGMASRKMSEVLTSDYFDLKHLYPLMRKVLLEDQIGKLLTSSKTGANSNFKIIEDWEEFKEFDRLPVLSRISIAEMSSYMQNVLLRDTDQMSMAHALEVRVPFLDHRLIEYMMHVNDEVKFPHSPKELLVDSFSDLLPAEIVNRPKMGFVLPWEQWMRSDLRPLCEERLAQLGAHEAFNETEINKLWKQFFEGKNLSWSRIWPLVSLSDWMIRNDVS